ncbi:hypothetical protein AAES_46392 [Amazona aestiva]|uniref:Uncharacterized protein n=1 Tax=Amazona aestiva TaxID=12930 RepID=A0A0Q3Q8P9_AMAAE|nr:hypothetical protein AAES_46392 [Amazona aestiva]
MVDLAGEGDPVLPVAGGEQNLFGGREGAVELGLDLEEVGAQGRALALAPGDVQALVAGQAGGHAEEPRALGHVKVQWGRGEDEDFDGGGVRRGAWEGERNPMGMASPNEAQ